MNNQNHSYSFPLSQGCENSFITSLKSKHFLIGGAVKDSQNRNSIFHLFKYEQDNPKKSFSVNKTVQGSVLDLVSNEENGAKISLAVIKGDNKYQIQQIFPEKIGSEQPILQNLYEQDNQINGLHFKKANNQVYFWDNTAINILDLEKKTKSNWVNTNGGKITSLSVDPIHQYLTYASDGKEVHIIDKKSNNQKYVIKACQKGGDKILNMDYNPNKQCFLMTCHHESIKFWDIRRGNVPVRCYDDHHNLLTQAKYNRSHDQLIACAYDDGTVALLRLHSVCSSPQSEIQDTLVKLYDEHEDSVFQVTWSAFSPWIFSSVTYNASSLVVNIVPNVEKYRILL